MYALIYTGHLYTNKVKNIRFHNYYTHIFNLSFRFRLILIYNMFRFETKSFRFKQK